MESILEIARRMKAKHSSSETPHEVRIPFPERDFARDNGARWNNEKKCHEIYANNVELHPLKHLLTTNENWIQLKHNVPFDYKEQFKEAGVVSIKVENKWQDYVLATEKYLELIEALTEAELL